MGTGIDTAGDGQDVVGPPCADVTLVCVYRGNRIGASIAVPLDSPALILCSITGFSQPRVTWTWTPEGGEAVDLATLSSERDFEFAPGRIGAGIIGVRLGDCAHDGPRVDVTAPETGLFIVLSWRSNAATVESSVDVDLHVLRDASLCWYDERDDLHYGSDTRLDWGARGVAEDDPRRSDDARTDAGIEFVIARGLPEIETWLVGVEVRSLGTASRADVSLDVFLDGATLLDASSPFAETGWWTVAELSDTGAVPIDDRGVAAPECDEACGDEVCNGVDDDCDGGIDEDPEACLNQEGIDGGSCSFIAGLDEYRCTEP